MNAIYLPMVFISGVFWSTESMPAFLRAIADVLPLTYLLELMRHVFLEEDALRESLGAIAVVALWGAARRRARTSDVQMGAPRGYDRYVTDSTLVFRGQGRAGRRLVVNFGVYSGREATEAEIYRLAQSLLDELGSVEIVAERRYEVDIGRRGDRAPGLHRGAADRRRAGGAAHLPRRGLGRGRDRRAPPHRPLTGPAGLHRGEIHVVGSLAGPSPVAQWIEQRFPKPRAQVQFLSGALALSEPISRNFGTGVHVDNFRRRTLDEADYRASLCCNCAARSR